MLQIRRFREGDLQALEELMSLLGTESLLPVPLEQRLHRPCYSPGEDLFLAEWGDRIVAYLDTFRELQIGRVIFESAMLPDYQNRAILPLLREGIKHAADIGAGVAHFPVLDREQRMHYLVQGEGFTPVRRFLRLSLQEENIPSIPPWPPIRPMNLGEEASLASIQNLSFAESWGFQPNTEEDIRYRLSLACCSYEGVFFAELEGKVVGYCWTRELNDRGEIWMLGVDPVWQGRGVGRALLLQGIHHLRRRGFQRIDLTVDAENAKAISLYHSLGFRRVGTIIWYERKL